MNIVKKFQNWNNTKLRKNVVKGIAGLVAFSVTYSLILPAITIDEETAENEPGIVLNENENSEEVLAGYEAPEEVTAEVPEEEPAVVEEAPAEEVQEEAAEEVNPVHQKADVVFAQENEVIPSIIDNSNEKALTGEDHSGRNLLNIVVFGGIALIILLVLLIKM